MAADEEDLTLEETQAQVDKNKEDLAEVLEALQATPNGKQLFHSKKPISRTHFFTTQFSYNAIFFHIFQMKIF